MLPDSPKGRGLLDVREFRVPRGMVEATLDILAEAGSRNCEAFVAWGGVRLGGREILEFRSVHRPAQRAAATPDGLLVSVDGESLHHLNIALFDRGEILAGQVHSHPGEAYHSDTDDHFPIVTLLGALSLVVPGFARAGRASEPFWAWYRLAGYANWVPAGPDTRIVIA